MSAYEIVADEAWTHQSEPLNRRWCFFGGLLGRQHEIDALRANLAAKAAELSLRGEIKWSKISPRSGRAYENIVAAFFDEFERLGSLRLRQIFLDRSYVPKPGVYDENASGLDIQYKLYYQFLKHSFGLEHLPAGPTNIIVRLDEHSSQQHQADLKAFVEQLPAFLKRRDLKVSVAFVQSSSFIDLQLCDVITGAAGWLGNKQQEIRQVMPDGTLKRGMTDKQKAKLKVAKLIQSRLEKIDAADRGSRAFDWWGSTALSSNPGNRLAHKFRTWCFHPKEGDYLIDKGWENDNLGPNRTYIGPILVDPGMHKWHGQ